MDTEECGALYRNAIQTKGLPFKKENIIRSFLKADGSTILSRAVWPWRRYGFLDIKSTVEAAQLFRHYILTTSSKSEALSYMPDRPL